METLWKLLYLGTAVNLILIALLFIKTRNGILRRSLVMFFGSTAWGLLVRFSVGMNLIFVDDKTILVMIAPMFITSAYLAKYLYSTFKT